MTNTLKKQLTVWAGAAILGGAGLGQSGAVGTQSGAAKPANSLAQIFGRARENARRSSCQSNLRQMSLGVVQYVQDYDEVMPPAKQWIDVLQPYTKTEQIFRCPSLPTGKNYGYALNSKVSGRWFSKIPLPSRTVLIYETQILNRNAYGLGEYRANRHQGGANFAFVDGHIKWFAQSAKPSFNLKP